MEVREEARQLGRMGLSLGEISKKPGSPKHTLTLWVRDIELTPEQREWIHERGIEANGLNRALASQAHREARLERIALANIKVVLRPPHPPLSGRASGGADGAGNIDIKLQSLSAFLNPFLLPKTTLWFII